MQEKLTKLKTRLAEVHDLLMSASVLEWDQETQMSDGSIQARAHQLATLRGMAHRNYTDEEVGALFDDLSQEMDGADYDSHDASLVRIGKRYYEQQVKVPTDFIQKMEEATSKAGPIWQKARKNNDFSLFEPALEEIFKLKLQYADYLADGEDNLYNVLLDNYDPGTSYEIISAVFTPLKKELVKLVAEINANQEAASDAILRRHYPHDDQLKLSAEIAEALGYDFNRGRLDLATHPFSISFSHYDVRITTRVYEDFLQTCLMGTIHEAGHAMYDQGIDPGLYRLATYPVILGGGQSMSIHESQSRFYENVLGRSRPFWNHFYPRAQEIFPDSLGDVTVDDFYKALNVSKPSLIRVEADEVSYGLHVMLRFELEQDIISGKVKISELPTVWNDRFEEYLGIRPPNDTEGVLQDIHWSMGLVGYFPSYLLGSIFATQLWETMKTQITDAEDQVTHGQFDQILGWLRENIHQHGSKFTFPEIVERTTGGSLQWEPYMNYLRTKFSEVYGL